MYQVCIVDGGELATNGAYPKGYFPVHCKSRKMAVQVAKEAVQEGAVFVRVECPNGVELDYKRPSKRKSK